MEAKQSSRHLEIIAIPESNNRKLQAKDFRPICLLPVVGKLFEKIITERLTKIAEFQKWIPNFQNGFRKKRSTLNNLIELQQEMHGAFKRNEYMLAVFLDIKKAYDCVDQCFSTFFISRPTFTEEKKPLPTLLKTYKEKYIKCF